MRSDPKRIVSLVPSSTEILLALGANVVACTRFCEQPGLAHVGGTKNPDLDAIVALAPDLVVLDQEENRRADAEALEVAGLELFVSDVTDLSSGLRVVGDLATATDTEVRQIEVPESEPIGVSVFVPIWRRPWMSINRQTYGASLLEHLGCTLTTAHLDAVYPDVTLDDVSEWRPDVIGVPSEPYEFTKSHIAELQAASPQSTVIRVDGQDLFWWGIRTPEAIKRLRRALVAPAQLT